MGRTKKEEATLQPEVIDTSFLKDERVIVEYIIRPSKDIRDPNHIAYGGKLDGCADYISPPRLRKDKLKNVLTAVEKKGLEHLMGRDLSIYSDFWKGYKKGGLFPIALTKEGITLDLSVPEQYIMYKVLLNNETLIAKSNEDLRKKGSYKYVIKKQNEAIRQEDEKVNKKLEAFELFSDVKSSKAKMRFILRQFGMHTSSSQKAEFLRGEMGKLIEKNTDLFIKVANDDKLDIKVLIQEGLELGVLRKNKNLYYTVEGAPLSDEGQEPTIENSAAFLSSPLGQEMRFGIEARIKNARE